MENNQGEVNMVTMQEVVSWAKDIYDISLDSTILKYLNVKKNKEKRKKLR